MARGFHCPRSDCSNHYQITSVGSRQSTSMECQPKYYRSAFLSELMKEVGRLLGFHKANTSAYHPQTDGLVERFNHTLTAMLAKTAARGGRDWDHHLPYVLFAYRASLQESTKESLFFLLYGGIQDSLPNKL